MHLPVLGVGLTYWPRLDPFVTQFPDAVDLLEVQPETVWLPPANGGAGFGYDRLAVERIASFPHPKVAHGVGFPVGGARRPDPAHLPPFREIVHRLGVPWASEHLAVNVAAGPDGGEYFTGFMLPPRQTDEAAAVAGAHAREIGDAVGLPFAVEPGVTYLRPRADELPDGEYVAAVLAASGGGLLLDLHNVWTNARNGRQPVADFLAAIPLDRVWEVHVAGGMEHDGFWLDAHSDLVPDEVMGLATDLLPDLPNVAALVYELVPRFYDDVGPDALRAQLDRLRTVWALRRPGPAALPAPSVRLPGGAGTEWDDAIAAAVLARPATGPLTAELAADPGARVLSMLLGEARGSMVAGALRLTIRLLLLHLGEAAFDALLARYWAAAAPERFGAREGQGFAAFLRAERLDVPHLDDVLAFELALLDALVSATETTVTFGADPHVVLAALAEGRLPEAAAAGAYPVVVAPG